MSKDDLRSLLSKEHVCVIYKHQRTCICPRCGYKQTELFPETGEKIGGWTIVKCPNCGVELFE